MFPTLTPLGVCELFVLGEISGEALHRLQCYAKRERSFLERKIVHIPSLVVRSVRVEQRVRTCNELPRRANSCREPVVLESLLDGWSVMARYTECYKVEDLH